MSLSALRRSLAYWRRKHGYRQWRLDLAHRRNDKKAIEKWHGRLSEAGARIKLRELQIKAATAPTARERIVAIALQAAANYRKDPAAYHYLAGGVPNTSILTPTPWNWRSDCSQFAVNVYRLAGVKCPGAGSYLYSNTISIAAGGTLTMSPRPGDLAMYGSRKAPHHVEVYIGNGRYVGHGTRPIDGVTPGPPSYYLSFVA